MNATTLKELKKQIKFHGENILIGVETQLNENYIVTSFVCKERVLILNVSHEEFEREVELIFFDRDNEEVVPSSNGIYRLQSVNNFIWALKFFLAVNDLSETSQ